MKDHSRCVPNSVMLGKSCENDSQCKNVEKLSECVKSVCQCRSRFIQVAKMCRSIVNKGKSSCEDSNCGGNEECLDKKCVCKDKFVASEVEVRARNGHFKF